MRLYTLFLISMSCVFLMSSPHQAQAQLLEKATGPKEVSLLFHRMADKPINYEEWAVNTQEYATAVDGRKEAVLEEESLNLQLEYSSIEKGKTDIIVRTQIATKIDDSPRVGLTLDFSADGPLFFPYQYMDERFAVIAQNIDLLKFIPLGKLESTYIKNKISPQGKTYMVLKIRPHKVDAREQTRIYEQRFWLMLGRIASIHLYNQELETLWSWTAEWYITEQDE